MVGVTRATTAGYCRRPYINRDRMPLAMFVAPTFGSIELFAENGKSVGNNRATNVLAIFDSPLRENVALANAPVANLPSLRAGARNTLLKFNCSELSQRPRSTCTCNPRASQAHCPNLDAYRPRACIAQITVAHLTGRRIRCDF